MGIFGQALVSSFVCACSLNAQTPAGVVNRHDAATLDSAIASGIRGQPPGISLSPRARSFAPLVSFIIPGGGQLMLGSQRSIAYFAIEAVTWWSYAKAAHEQSADEANFKEVARTVARAHFASGSPTDLPDGPWSYYELMRDHKESGQYSLAVGGEVVPETDTSTYNGKQWRLAQASNSTRAAALDQYKRAAVKPEFEWSWKNAQLQFDVFTRLTFQRDDAYAAGTRALLVAGANHVFSLVDAFTTLRLRARAESNGRTSIGASVPW